MLLGQRGVQHQVDHLDAMPLGQVFSHRRLRFSIALRDFGVCPATYSRSSQISEDCAGGPLIRGVPCEAPVIACRPCG